MSRQVAAAGAFAALLSRWSVIDPLQVLRYIERAGEGVTRDASLRVVYQGGFRRPVVGEQGYRAGGVSYPDALQCDLPGDPLIHS